MLRSSIYTASALLLGASAFAQSDMSARVHPITAPIKNAGTLNLATGKWTRHAHQANGGGPGTIYNNTCDTGYFGGIENPAGGAGVGEIIADEGRLPSTSSPKNAWVAGNENNSSEIGCADSYDVDGFQIGYCTDQLAIEINLDFAQSYDSCTDIHDLAANPGGITAAFAIQGLPASQTLLTQACWLVTLDLNAPPQTTSLVFNFLADGDGAADGVDNTTDLFGWSFEVTTPTGAVPSQTGFIIAGDGFTCAGYDGTIFNQFNPDLTIGGTGMTALDQFRVDGPPTNPANAGCYWFGGAPGNPMGGWHLELYQSGMVGPCKNTGTSYCVPGVDANLCPCFTSAGQIAAADHGCGNSVNTGGAHLAATGPVDITNGNDNLNFVASEMTFGTSSIFLQGSTDILPGVLFGDGRRCAGGALIRLGQKIDTIGGGDPSPNDAETKFGPANGDLQVSALGGCNPGDTRIYQTYYRNPNAGWCPPQTFNVTQAISITWL